MIVSQKQAEEALALLAPWGGDAEVRATDLSALTQHPDRVTELYRAAARGTHPDLGGTCERFAAVDRAKHVLLAWLARPQSQSADHKKEPCDYCGGSGHIYSQGRLPGSQGLRRTCPKCRGSGDADIDLHNP